MCPFLDEEDFDDYEEVIEAPKREKEPGVEFSFLKNDRKFFVIGGLASLVAFSSVVYFLYTNSKPVNLDDLPVVKADPTPIKVRPQNNTQVQHQDKVVYDNISGDMHRRDEKECVISQPEEILSISEMDSDGVLSPEEKRKIISAFDDLAPADTEKEYRVNYVKDRKQKNEQRQYDRQDYDDGFGNSEKKERIIGDLKIVEDDPSLPPIKRNIEQKKRDNESSLKTEVKNKGVKRHTKIADILGQTQRPKNRKEIQKRWPLSQRKSATRYHMNQWNSRGKGDKRYHGYEYFSLASRSNKGSDNASNVKMRGVMVQIGSVPTKNGAESEYKRISNRSPFIRNYSRRIYKADLGTRGSTYRIQLGPFKSDAEARMVVSKLKGNGCPAYILR